MASQFPLPCSEAVTASAGVWGGCGHMQSHKATRNPEEHIEGSPQCLLLLQRSAPVRGGAFHRQLENNTTKALINTLELAEPSVRRAFMEWLGIRAGRAH